jgi:hypothetical protein
MHRVGELQTVHTARHLDIGEKQRDIGTRLEDGDSFVSVHGLDRGKAGVFHHINRAHAQHHFVLDDENDRRDNGMIQGHHDGISNASERNQSAPLLKPGWFRVTDSETSIPKPI